MPRGDRRGPDGMGPMTGRGMGYCAGSDSPGFTGPMGQGVRGGGGRGRGGGQRGRGYGGGCGGGYGRGGFGGGYGRGMAPMAQDWRPYPDAVYAAPPADEAEMLKTQAEYLEEALKEVRDRLSSLEDKE